MVGVVSLLTDFGSTDYYVGAIKGTLLRLAPGVQPVDISHDLAPGDVEAASFVLSAAAPSFPPGTVHLAVVDPGVGGARRILAVEGADTLFVAPDNGLLTRQFDGASIYSVEDESLYLPAPGQTFHGRDRFAPVAAFLLRGGALERLGPAIDDPVRLPLTPPAREAGRLRGRVVHVDRYGNLVTDLPADWLEATRYEARIADHATRRRVSAYCELAPGEAGWLIGSLGTVELSLNGADLARAWSVARGAAVTLEAIAPDGEATGDRFAAAALGDAPDNIAMVFKRPVEG